MLHSVCLATLGTRAYNTPREKVGTNTSSLPGEVILKSVKKETFDLVTNRVGQK